MQSFILGIFTLFVAQHSSASEISLVCKKATEQYLERFKMGSSFDRPSKDVIKNTDRGDGYTRVTFVNEVAQVIVHNDDQKGYYLEFCQAGEGKDIQNCSRVQFGDSNCESAQKHQFSRVTKGNPSPVNLKPNTCLTEKQKWPCRDHLDFVSRFGKVGQSAGPAQGSVQKSKAR